MSTERQKAAARENLEKAREVRSARARRAPVPRPPGLTQAQENRMKDSAFAFPKERKEPLSDAAHVRNAISRFNQVEDVSDVERDAAWKRIKSAARRFGVEVGADSWRDLKGGSKAGTGPAKAKKAARGRTKAAPRPAR